MNEPEKGLPLVDVHAHMYDKAFEQDLEEVLGRAEVRGIKAILAVSETLADAVQIQAMAERHGVIKPCAGLHPEIVNRDRAEEMLAFIRQHGDGLVAIGEVGLDYWQVKDPSKRDLQRLIFAQHISLAREIGLPLNVHSRSAGRHAIAWLKAHHAQRVLMHAFDGKVSAAKEGIDAGYYFSIPPSIVRSPQKQKLVRDLPLDRLLLESDAPVLGPSREERNEPQNVWVACAQIATIKALAAREVALITTENARRLFSRAFD
jgi:TatD DNase family protein